MVMITYSTPHKNMIMITYSTPHINIYDNDNIQHASQKYDNDSTARPIKLYAYYTCAQYKVCIDNVKMSCIQNENWLKKQI